MIYFCKSSYLATRYYYCVDSSISSCFVQNDMQYRGAQGYYSCLLYGYVFLILIVVTWYTIIIQSITLLSTTTREFWISPDTFLWGSFL